MTHNYGRMLKTFNFKVSLLPQDAHLASACLTAYENGLLIDTQH
ncbi:MAG TPA: hypothetical protein PKI30_10040 [Bacillota bacterium]|jgi:hypothetical protein|nr:hypothetical protein [Bacillota bacterium]